MNVLEMSGVSKEFKTKNSHVRALDDLHLGIGEGEILGLLGPNGSGKTTTVKTACGLLTPDCGKVLVLGRDPARQRSAVLRDVGVLLEPGRGVYKNMTVLENITYWGLVKGFCDKRELTRRATELIEFFDIREKKDSLASTLSTGMIQKLNLCCTLVTGPRLLLLDEPNVGMDYESSSYLVERLKWLACEKRCAVLVTSHQMDFMEELCDEVAFISGGRVALRGSIDQVRWLFRRKLYNLAFRWRESDTPDLSGRLPGTMTLVTGLDNQMAQITADSETVSVHELLKLALDEELEVVSLELVRPSLKECYRIMFSGGGGVRETG